MRSIPSLALASLVVAGAFTACGDGDSGETLPTSGDASASPVAGADRPSVVATTNIIGDIAARVLGDQADIEVRTLREITWL